MNRMPDDQRRPHSHHIGEGKQKAWNGGTREADGESSVSSVATTMASTPSAAVTRSGKVEAETVTGAISRKAKGFSSPPVK